MGTVALKTASGGSVILSPANTASDVTITVPAGTGTMAVNGPAFSAYPTSASQTPAVNTFTKVTLGTEYFDTNSNFDTVNSRFQPTIAGYYQINGSVTMNSTVIRMIVSIYKNGTEYVRGYDVQASCASGLVSSVIYLNGSTDYVELYTLNGSGGVLVYNVASTQFSGAMVRSA